MANSLFPFFTAPLNRQTIATSRTRKRSRKPTPAVVRRHRSPMCIHTRASRQRTIHRHRSLLIESPQPARGNTTTKHEKNKSTVRIRIDTGDRCCGHSIGQLDPVIRGSRDCSFVRPLAYISTLVLYMFTVGIQ